MKVYNDKLILTDVLTQLKFLLTKYGTAFQESSCPKMRALVTKLSGKVGEHQFAIFEYMNKNGLYPIENADQPKITQVLAMHTEASYPCG